MQQGWQCGPRIADGQYQPDALASSAAAAAVAKMVAAGGLELVGVILGIHNGYWQQKLNHQRAEQLSFWRGAQEEVAVLHNRTLAAQKRLEQRQQAQRERVLQQQDLSLWLGFIHLLSAEIPQDIWLSGLKKNLHSVSLKGGSRSVEAIHHLRDGLYQQQKIQTITLGSLHREPPASVSFSMQLTLGNKDLSNE